MKKRSTQEEVMPDNVLVLDRRTPSKELAHYRYCQEQRLPHIAVIKRKSTVSIRWNTETIFGKVYRPIWVPEGAKERLTEIVEARLKKDWADPQSKQKQLYSSYGGMSGMGRFLARDWESFVSEINVILLTCTTMEEAFSLAGRGRSRHEVRTHS
jgi:hypothetical protein